MVSNQHIRNTDYLAIGIVALVTVLSSLVAYRPSQLYFFGDTWDILCEFHEQGWPTVWRMHNEHFMPVSKVLLCAQYQLFGMNNFPYQLVSFLIHGFNAALLYVVAGELTECVIPRIFGALFFAFSGVYWEVTMWEAGQQTALALFFILLALSISHRFLTNGDPKLLAFAMLSALLASWSMGLGLLVVPILIAQAIVWGRNRWKRALAISGLSAAAVVSGFALLLWTDRAGFALARSRASLSQAMQVFPWTFIALRGLAASYAAPFWPHVIIGAVFLLVGLIFWRSFASKERLLMLLLPVSMLLLPYALTAAGRVQLGIALASSSRYQYIPAAALGLMLAWAGGGVFAVVRNRYPTALFPLSLALLLTLPLDALAGYEYIRLRSPFFEWGRQARRFVSLAVYHRGLENVPAGMGCVRPELYLPVGMYPRPFFDIARALPLFAANGVPSDGCSLSVLSAMGSQEFARDNLLKSGRWQSYGQVAAPADPAGTLRIGLSATSAYGLTTTCANTVHPYTFAASVRLVSGDPSACMRILFKDAGGRIITTYPSKPIASHNFSPLAISAYPEPNTATVAADFAASAESVIEVKDPVLVAHPVYLPITSAGRNSQ